MPEEKLSLIVIVVCLAGLLWLLPLAVILGPAIKDSITASGVFLTLVLSGVFYALRKNGADE